MFILALVLAWVAILLGGGLAWQLLRQNGRLLLRLEEIEKRLNELEFGEGEEPSGLPVGSEAPPFELADLAEKTHSLAQYRGEPLLLLFFNPACGFCRELTPKLAELYGAGHRAERGVASPPRLLIVSSGDANANRALFDSHDLSCPILLQNEAEVATTYQAHGTPSGYLISSSGTIASPLAMGADAFLALANGKNEEPTPDSDSVAGSGNGDRRENRFSKRSLAGSKIKRDGLKAGTLAPDFRLPRLDGQGELGLADLRGSRVLLVFSSPECGPCSALAPHLEKFHREHPELKVVMISKGEPRDNRAKVKAHALTFPIVLQQQWEISRRYGMFATPIAYLIDEAGVIVHDVALGLEPIQSLMGEAAKEFASDRSGITETVPPRSASA